MQQKSRSDILRLHLGIAQAVQRARKQQHQVLLRLLRLRGGIGRGQHDGAVAQALIVLAQGVEAVLHQAACQRFVAFALEKRVLAQGEGLAGSQQRAPWLSGPAGCHIHPAAQRREQAQDPVALAVVCVAQHDGAGTLVGHAPSAVIGQEEERQRAGAGVGTDDRAGLPSTYGTKHWQYTSGYYHVSSHLGDHDLLANFKQRVHYVRDELILGLSFKPISAIRLYGEAGWAFNAGETTSPWEFQFGAEYSPVYHPLHAWRGAPFAAVCGHLFEELHFSGYFNSQVGWQWRGPTNSRLRLGAEFYCGCDDQFQCHRDYQRKVGFGLWSDY